MTEAIEVLPIQLETLSLREKVAQLFMLGYEGTQPNAITERFLAEGLGGLIFFRDNFDQFQPHTPEALKAFLEQLQTNRPSHLPPLLMGIDQEGGQVERLPHTLFPTLLTPRAIALSKNPEQIAREMYGLMAQQLTALGFNLNFFPTLDVNLEAKNPIIGVRSFGDNAETVSNLAQIAYQCFEHAGLISVGKHFPGHGNGTVDSHLDLPVLRYTEEELSPFQEAIQAGLPVMLVAHGFYPALQTNPSENGLPSSASKQVIQTLLKDNCGFNGVIITDDMCMGAITRYKSPAEAALASIEAGVDILLYKQSTEAEWEVYEALVALFSSGELPLSRLDESVARILKLKARYLSRPSEAVPLLSTKENDEKAFLIAQAGISLQQGSFQALPLALDQTVLVVHPNRKEMGNYAFDVSTSAELDEALNQVGFEAVHSLTYPPKQATPELVQNIPNALQPKTIVFVSFNPLINAGQADLYEALKTRYPQAQMVLASAGTPYDLQALSAPDLYLALCSYRPASIHALAKLLKTGF